MTARYAEYFEAYINARHRARTARPDACASYDLARLGAALKPERDLQFTYLGLQTLYDRYFLHCRRHPLRAAAGLLHARGHGPGHQ